MARVPYLEKADLAPEDRDLLAREITLHKAMAHSPKAARAFQRLGHFIRHDSKLDARLRELAILQVGYLARSPYEFSHHIKIGRDFGVSDEDIRGLIEESHGRPSALEPLARAVCRAAREMTEQMEIGDGTYAELEAGLSRETLTDLVIAIAFYNAVVRYLATMRIDVEPEYRKYLDQFPLPAK